MRFYFWLFLFFPSFSNIQSEPTGANKKRDELLLTAEKFLGLKYKSKVSKNIFDCSGYVRFIMAGIGINITRSSVSQIHDGKRVKDVKNTRPGDILVFKGRNHRNNRPGHVGLAHHWSNDTLYFIHSSVSSGIRIDHLKETYYSKRFLQVRDVIGD
ncbi:MAG: C40 family peptidase [Saprospiraceae bacterium]|nr:C40 family peptidase [Saprospiraceae bacterium]